MVAICVSELRKTYGTTTAVDDVTFEVEVGEIFGLLGRNGAGKTTTVEMIEGITKPDSGQVRVLGLDPFDERDDVRLVLGAQLQESQLPARLRVEEALRLYSSFYPDPVPVDELLEKVGLTEKRRTAFDELSGGQQQRLSVALALIGRPRVAILDEVTTGLDPAARRGMWDTILRLRDSGVTVLLVTHFMEEAERLCDRVALLDAGRVIALDTPGTLIDQSLGGSTITFDVSAEPPVEELETLPGVTQVSVDGSTVVVRGNGDLVTEVTGALHRAGTPFSGLDVNRATLEAAFLHLTEHHGDQHAGEDE